MFTYSVQNPNKLFFTSDTHFRHGNIVNYCKRPWRKDDGTPDTKAMTDALINNWNAVVPKDGIVVHCGDFMLNHSEDDVRAYYKIANKLNGKIILCRGNHDRIPLNIEPVNNIIAVVDCAMINVDGIRIYAQHYPCDAWNGDLHVFGHIHTLSDGSCYGLDADVAKRCRCSQVKYDVGVDQNNYTPISYFQLCETLRMRSLEKEEKRPIWKIIFNNKK